MSDVIAHYTPRAQMSRPLTRTLDEGHPFTPALSQRSRQIAHQGKAPDVVERLLMKQREYDSHHHTLRGQKEQRELATLQPSPAINQRSRLITGRAPANERLARPRTLSERSSVEEASSGAEKGFVPTINERSRVLERSVGQMYSWAYQRDANREVEQARALQRSVDVTGTPRLNDISCRIVANLGLTGRVEDRLLRAHKERDEKVQRLQEAKAAPVTATPVRHHPGPRLHDEPRRRSVTPTAAPTFRPRVNANAASHRDPATDVFSHLHQDGQRAADHRRRMEEPPAPDETFQPAINHTSRALATLRQTHYADPVKATAAAPDPALTFQPRIDPHSAALDRRLNAGDGTRDRVALLHAKCQGYVAHRARMGEQRSQEALAGCTFRPETTEYAAAASDGGAAMDVVARNAEWDLRRRSRLEKERLIRSDSDGAECTFRPKLTVVDTNRHQF